ncbi:MAG: hypothetical protein M3268_00660 [Acidobacteriota bacterium]|nr:hypothetical protein [Acidobacteriota bacterium]
MLATLVLLAAFTLGFAGAARAQDDGLDPIDPNGAGGNGTCIFTCQFHDPPCDFTPVDWHCYNYKCAYAACSNTERPCWWGNGICNGAYQVAEYCVPDECAGKT